MPFVRRLNNGLPEESLYRYIESKRTAQPSHYVIIGAIVSAANRNPNGAFAPIVDGANGIMPDLPSHLITTGKFASVDFLGGHCTGDGNTFAGGNPTQFVTEDDIRTRVFARWPGVVRFLFHYWGCAT